MGGSGSAFTCFADSFMVSEDNAEPATFENAKALIAAELNADVIFQISSRSHSILIVGVEGINWPSGSGSTSSTFV